VLINEREIKQSFDRAVNTFIIEQIRKKSITEKIAKVKTFDRGSKWIIERKGAEPIVLEPKEHLVSGLIKDEAIINSDYEMVRASFENMADKLVNERDKEMLEEMRNKAGFKVDAKGDILSGLIEGAKKLREHNGYNDELILVISPEQSIKLKDALEKDPEKAKQFRELMSKKA
jgi:hypothetical protein